MKKTHIPASPFYMYLTAIPLIIILVLSIISNSSSEGLLKLYPLILATAAAIIFILVYLLRYITVSVEEIKIFGLFSSRDKAIINKGKTLIMTETKKGVRLLTLFGNDGERPMLDWTQGEDYVPVDINLFRERIYGGKGSFSKILKFFDVNEEDIERILTEEEYTVEYPDFTVTRITGEVAKDIKIYFKETI